MLNTRKKRGSRGLLADAEGITQWVTRHLARFGLGLNTMIERHLADPRTGHNRQFPLPDIFRQSI